jgi:hypothetical protein
MYLLIVYGDLLIELYDLPRDLLWLIVLGVPLGFAYTLSIQNYFAF